MLKKILEKIKRNKKEEFILKGEIYCNTIYSNNHVDIIHDAFKECVKGKPIIEYEDKLKYIEDKVRMGHESVLEHSNLIMYLIFSAEYNKELNELLTLCKYLNTKVIYKNDNKIIQVYIAGSIRGFKHIIRNCKSEDNRLVKEIVNDLYNQPSCYFIDFIEDNIMDKSLFIDIEDESNICFNTKESKKYDIINIDNLENIISSVEGNLELDDILDMTSITIHFKDISRVISQQFTRHRAGITQLSQRYVDNTNFKFNSPSEFKPDLYNEKQKYTIKIKDEDKANPIEYRFSLQELGEELVKIYSQLKEQGLVKEDARAYLPNNTVTSFYMTFTLKNFIKFLQLRTDKHAQAEIRKIALSLEVDFSDYMSKYSNKWMYDYLMPAYKQLKSDTEYYDNIDEIID